MVPVPRPPAGPGPEPPCAGHHGIRLLFGLHQPGDASGPRQAVRSSRSHYMNARCIAYRHKGLDCISLHASKLVSTQIQSWVILL
eukprot:scaffold103621_cov36-Prasinocladus_malaysianus.AAC.1